MIDSAVNIDSWIKREHYKSDCNKSSESINQTICLIDFNVEPVVLIFLNV